MNIAHPTAPSPAEPASPTPSGSPASPARLWGTRIGWLAAFAVPAWLVGSRLLTGTAGDLTVVYALTLAPLLLVLSVAGLAVPRRRGQLPSGRSLGLLGVAWAAGIGLGVTLPDVGNGAASVLEAWSGPEMAGVAAAISNPLGIALGLCGLVGCVLAVRDSRSAGPSRVTDEDEAQGTGFFPTLEV